MDINEMLKNLGESLADYTVGKHLEEIGNTLNDLADKNDDPTKKLAYRIASMEVLRSAVERMIMAHEKLPIEEDEAD